jgi:isoquinoline 1-oxidoreductase alpha subunit
MMPAPPNEEPAMIDFELNGRRVQVDAPDDTPLLWVLRDELGLTGTKFGCGKSLCGACTVHLDGAPTRSCQLPLSGVAGRKITTIEGLDGRVALAVQKAWDALQVVQCGYCQSGQVMAATALLTTNAKPDDAAIESALSGNLCRCGTYGRVRQAIRAAAQDLEGKA